MHKLVGNGDINVFFLFVVLLIILYSMARKTVLGATLFKIKVRLLFYNIHSLFN